MMQKTQGNFSQYMYSGLPNIWGTFPTSAIIPDLDSHLFHKSMKKHGFSHGKFQLDFLS
jgi:hypothetical protein